jgi:hypothetical protein
VLFYPPEGRSAGQVRYRERLAPLRSFAALVQEVLAADPEWQTIEAAVREPLVTTEGEYAFFLTLDGTIGAAPCRRFIGAVYGDDFASVIDTLCRDPARAVSFEQLARELLRDVSLGLGVRRRRFLYTPPQGWQALPTGLVANFYPPGFPEDLTNLVVYPANPRAGPAESVFEELLRDDEERGFVLDALRGPAPVSSDHGLPGKHWQLTGILRGPGPGSRRARHRELVVLDQAPYLYSLHLDTYVPERLSEHRAILLQVARAAHPIPIPGQRSPRLLSPNCGDLLRHWS